MTTEHAELRRRKRSRRLERQFVAGGRSGSKPSRLTTIAKTRPSRIGARFASATRTNGTVLGLEHAGRFDPPAMCLGGSERIALLALEQLARRGFRVLLACPPGTELARAAEARGIPVRPMPFLAMHRTREARTIAEYGRSVATVGRRVDLVHSSD